MPRSDRHPDRLERLVPDHAQRRADGLDAAAVRDLDGDPGKLAFPRISAALDKRQQAIELSIDEADETKRQADELLNEYRERLAEARKQADEIIERARKAGETHERESEEEAKARGEQLMEQARRDIETETQRAIQEIRREVADLTVLATEKVTRKVLTEEDQRRLVEEALSEIDFSDADRGGGHDDLVGGTALMEEVAEVYARALFEVGPGARRRSTRSASELGQFADALERQPQPDACSSSRPYFSGDEKKDALRRAVEGAEPELHQLPRGADRAPPDAGDLPDPRPLRPALGGGAQAAPGRGDERRRARRADVQEIGDRVGEQTGRTGRALEPRRSGDPRRDRRCRVGNFILDASIRNRLEQLRKQVAQA